MKSREIYFDDFLARLSDDGFSIKTVEGQETDLVAEVYYDKCLFCSISKDGEIFYEFYDDERIEKIEDCAAQSREMLGLCSLSPFPNCKSFMMLYNKN